MPTLSTVQVHLLVSAHPIYRHSAFIMGNANEPPKGPPSLELVEMQVSILRCGAAAPRCDVARRRGGCAPCQGS